MMKRLVFLFVCAGALFLFACKKDKKKEDSNPSTPAEPKLIFKFKFDSTQVRLDNLGQPSTIASGHAAQSPVFRGMSAHYIELAQTDYTALGSGAVLYRAPETTAGGSNAITFDSARVAGQGEVFYSIPLKNVAAGSYKWLRVSLAYQNYDIKYKFHYLGNDYYLDGTLAAFIGFKTYINSYKIKTATIPVNGNKDQGYWGFETGAFGLTNTATGQATITTVPNPLSATSPIPPGSCVVTGQFPSNLVITGNETSDVVVTVSLSTNKSFEWNDTTADGWFEPNDPAYETLTDMGVRGLIPYVQQ